MKYVDTAIVLDSIGAAGKTPDEEKVEIFNELCNNGIPANVIVSGAGMHIIKDKVIDLLIIDYGGLSTGGAYDTAVWQINAALQWAEDHPGKLLVIWTTFTAKLVAHEFDAWDNWANVLFKYAPTWESFDEADKRMDKCFSKIRHWFGLDNEPPNEYHTNLIAPPRRPPQK